MLIHHYTDPFEGLAASVVTSNVVDTRVAFDLTLSWRTTAGTASVHSYQVTNLPSLDSARDTTYDAHWSTFTTFGSTGGSTTTTFEPPLGYRFARILRNPSGASAVVELNQLVR